MGDRVELGHLVYSVFETQWKMQLGEGSAEQLPQNRFFLVHLSITNGGNAPLLVPAMILVDDHGQTHGEMTSGDVVPRWLGYIRQVNPNESIQGNIAFDVSPAHYRLQVRDQDDNRSAFIDLPLTFSSETQTLPAPAK